VLVTTPRGGGGADALGFIYSFGLGIRPVGNGLSVGVEGLVLGLYECMVGYLRSQAHCNGYDPGKT